MTGGYVSEKAKGPIVIMNLYVPMLKEGFDMISECFKTFQRGMGNTARVGYAKGFWLDFKMGHCSSSSLFFFLFRTTRNLFLEGNNVFDLKEK